jgi:Nucleoside 2-deoxyribosyltransferase like
MKVIYAPKEYTGDEYYRIFLAGSIEMGKAVDWQTELIEKIKDISNAVIFNPRRKDWDSTWSQTLESKQFVEQVTWELAMLESSNVRVFYFDPATKSPITLLELGLFGRGKDKDVVVCCPPCYWRKGNVDIVCKRYKITQVENIDQLANYILYI